MTKVFYRDTSYSSVIGGGSMYIRSTGETTKWRMDFLVYGSAIPFSTPDLKHHTQIAGSGLVVPRLHALVQGRHQSTVGQRR